MLHLGIPGYSQNDDVEEESELESEVKRMAETILDCRTCLSGKLTTTFASLLSAQRPLFPHFESGSGPGPSTNYSLQGSQEAAKCSEPAALSVSDKKTTEKVHLLKEKLSSNIALMPIVLKRMRECMSKIDKLDSSDQVIHPAVKRNKLR